VTQPSATITSRRSSRVQAITRLHESKGRRAAGQILVEGPDGLAAALSASVPVEQVLVTGKGRSRAAGLLEQAQAAGALVIEVTEQVMNAIAQTQAPQGIVAACAWRPVALATAITPGTSSLILEAVADPGNVGTIIRTADAVGLGAVVLTEGSADPGNGKCVRASAGSIFHLPVCAGVSAQQALAQARRVGQETVVVTADAPVSVFDWARDRGSQDRVCWILGSEAHGVSELMRRSCDASVRIPMLGRTESLNVASAAAVCLYACLACGMED
jgi:TrmH family RNA methyltransferase